MIMKPTALLLAFSLFVSTSSDQKKTSFKRAVKQKDSISYEHVCDTMYGKISYPFDMGTVTGEGMIERCATWENHYKPYKARITPTKDSTIIGSYGNQVGGSNEAYIKVGNGWRLALRGYTFTPYTK